MTLGGRQTVSPGATPHPGGGTARMWIRAHVDDVLAGACAYDVGAGAGVDPVALVGSLDDVPVRRAFDGERPAAEGVDTVAARGVCAQVDVDPACGSIHEITSK